MAGITTHVLDTSLGKPGEGIKVQLEILEQDSWTQVGQGVTNNDGRVAELFKQGFEFRPSTYRITFDLKDYFSAQNKKAFYPTAQIVFNVENATEHFHIPLLLSNFGYSTYRGS
jgi:5-hydroxyisourate hydrolase